MKRDNCSPQSGFTYVEMMIVIAILALVMIASMFGDHLQIFKSYDTVRKSDLNKLKIAFENYYNDHDCYPHHAQEWVLDNCNSTNTYLAPYIDRIPCDPASKKPYKIWPNDDPNQCFQWYQLFTYLDNFHDPSISNAGCSGVCGPTNPNHPSGIYNYGVSSDNTSPNEPMGPGSLTQLWYYCETAGNCNDSNGLTGKRCPSNQTFTAGNCNPAATDINGCDPADVCTPR